MKNNVREIRKNLKIKAIEFANALGTSEQQLRRLEVGERKMTLEWIEKITKAFHSLGFRDIKSTMLIDPTKIPEHLFEESMLDLDAQNNDFLYDDLTDKEIIAHYRALPKNLRNAVDNIFLSKSPPKKKQKK